jgi:hypothetical protein
MCLSMDESAATFIPNESSNRARRHQQLGLVKSLRLVRVSIQESLKDCFKHQRLNVVGLD